MLLIAAKDHPAYFVGVERHKSMNEILTKLQACHKVTCERLTQNQILTTIMLLLCIAPSADASCL